MAVSYTHLDVYKRQSVYSMAAETALYLNGKLIGVQPSGKPNHFLSLIHIFPYFLWANRAPGEMAVWIRRR